jgi:hypothetical protein
MKDSHLVFDIDGVATIINGICATLTSAIIIFLFVWLLRRIPQLKISAYVTCGPQKAFFWDDLQQLIEGPYEDSYEFNYSIALDIHNDSKYTVRNLKVKSLEYEYSYSFNITKNGITIQPEQRVQLSVMKTEKIAITPDTWDSVIEAQREKYNKPFKIVLTYQNDDKRPFWKTYKSV